MIQPKLYCTIFHVFSSPSKEEDDKIAEHKNLLSIIYHLQNLMETVIFFFFFFFWGGGGLYIFFKQGNLFLISKFNLGWCWSIYSPRTILFPIFSTLKTHDSFRISYSYLTVFMQLSWGDTHQIWMWFKESNRYVGKIKFFPHRGIIEQCFMFCQLVLFSVPYYTGLILGLRPANERRRYFAYMHR